MNIPRLNHLQKCVVAYVLIGLTSEAAADRYLDPETARLAQEDVSFILEGLGNLQSLLREPENWIDIKFQSKALNRAQIIELELLNLYVELQAAGEPDNLLPVSTSFGNSTVTDAQYGYLLSIIEHATFEAVKEFASELEPAFKILSNRIKSDLFSEDCSNGIDDDGDGLADREDPECL